MPGPFSADDVLRSARTSRDGAGFVIAVRYAENRAGAVLVADETALSRTETELNEWIADELNRLCSRWSHGVVAGRMLGVDGLPLS